MVGDCDTSEETTTRLCCSASSPVIALMVKGDKREGGEYCSLLITGTSWHKAVTSLATVLMVGEILLLEQLYTSALIIIISRYLTVTSQVTVSVVEREAGLEEEASTCSVEIGT
jgi:hypothetical protein